MTQTVFYSCEMMQRQAHRMEYEFEKECINQMARSNLRKYGVRFEGNQSLGLSYKVQVAIGQGLTYSKYNTLMHFLNVVEMYWANPDLSATQVTLRGEQKANPARPQLLNQGRRKGGGARVCASQHF